MVIYCYFNKEIKELIDPFFVDVMTVHSKKVCYRIPGKNTVYNLFKKIQ